MPFESVSIRMTRSSAAIAWGCEFAQRGGDLVIVKIVAGSMAEKAGVRVGDEVVELCGRPGPRDLATVAALTSAALSIELHLKRPIVDSPSLDWALREYANGRMTVETSGDQVGLHRRAARKCSLQSQHAAFRPSVDEIERRRFVRNVTETPDCQAPPAAATVDAASLPYNRVTHQASGDSNWDREDDGVRRHYESKRSYTRTESSNAPFGAHEPNSNDGERSQQFHSGAESSRRTIFDDGDNGGRSWNAESGGFAAAPPLQSIRRTTSYTSAPPFEQKPQPHADGRLPRFQQNQYNAQPTARESRFAAAPAPPPNAPNAFTYLAPADDGGQQTFASSAHPDRGRVYAATKGGDNKRFGGYPPAAAADAARYSQPPRAAYPQAAQQSLDRNARAQTATPRVAPTNQPPIFYNPPNARSQRELSPSASIRQLQYNDPSALYSSDAFAEAYAQQTGRPYL